MEQDIGKACRECGKIWTEEDEKKQDEEVKKSFTVKPYISKS